MATDPIGDIVAALVSAKLVTPTPKDIAEPPQAVVQWDVAASPDTLLTTIATLMQLVYGASSDMHAVGDEMSTALTKVADVVKSLAQGLATVGDSVGDVSAALDALQKALALAQTLAPGSATTVLTSGSQLFTQLQGLIATAGSVTKAAAELAQLSQQLRTLATSLKP